MRSSEAIDQLLAVLAVDPHEDGDSDLVGYLETHGFLYPHRSATNVRLLSYLFSPSLLRSVIIAALSSPLPDMALNNLERISTSVPREDLVKVVGARCADAVLAHFATQAS